MTLKVGQVYMVEYHANPKRIDPYLVYEERGWPYVGVIRLTDMFVTYAHNRDWGLGHFPYEAVERLF
jgi:hypothetical protein